MNSKFKIPYTFTATIQLSKPKKMKTRLLKIRWRLDNTAYNQILNAGQSKKKQINNDMGLECTYVLPKQNNK